MVRRKFLLYFVLVQIQRTY